MAKFKFVGDPRMSGKDQTAYCELRGIRFEKDKWTDVDDKLRSDPANPESELFVDELARHSHFIAEGEKEPKAERPEAPSKSKAK